MDANKTNPIPGRQDRDAAEGNNRPAIRFGEAYSATPLLERLPGEELLLHLQQTRPLRQQPRQVYFATEILEGIRHDLDKTPRVERGGLLIGHAFRDLDDQRAIFTVVIGAISQPSQDSSVGHYTVTPAMITRARHTLEEYYPGSAVVGWYHSHPGHGIFLSEQDMRIVRSIYNAPWQIAFVRDTIRNKEGVFYGPEGLQLDGWLELRTLAPDFMRAADLYRLLQDSSPDQRPELVSRLRALVIDSPFLGHWRGLGRYQDMGLHSAAAAPAPTTVTATRDEIDLIDQIALFEPSPLPPHTAEPPAPPATTPPSAPTREYDANEWNETRRQYQYANDLAKKGNIQSGLQIVRVLAQKYPDLPYFDQWIRYWEAVDQRSRPRRPGRPDEPYFD